MRSTIASNRPSSSGAVSATAARWEATVSSSPRATGPVSARSGPSSAQFSTVLRTSGASSVRAWSAGSPAPAAICSAAASSVTRKLDADRRGGVVGGAAVVGQLERHHAQAQGQLARHVQRAPGSSRPSRSPRPAGGAGLVAGERLERVEAELSVPAVASAVRGSRRWCGPPSGPSPPRPRRPPGSRRRARTAAPRRRAAVSPRPSGPADLVAGLAQRGGQRPAEASGTHHADALGRERLICGDRLVHLSGPAAGTAM